MGNINQQLEKAEKVLQKVNEDIARLKKKAAKPERGPTKWLTLQVDVDRLAKFREKCHALDLEPWEAIEEMMHDWDKKKRAQS